MGEHTWLLPSLSLISFSLCYALSSAAIDVQALLQKVEISTNETGEKVGTFALAYMLHTKLLLLAGFLPQWLLLLLQAGLERKTNRREAL